MIIMAGIDYKLAPLEMREKLSFTDETLAGAYQKVVKMPEIEGCVILSTCNRTELYAQSQAEIDPFLLLCELAGTDAGEFKHYTQRESGAMRHLCRLAGGAISQILGEDQIITQVKTAITTAREAGVSCNVLEVLFREAVTAAKRIKSEIKLGTRENSIADMALGIVRRHEGISTALVIGNGEIGRLTARKFSENGYDTAMTLRTYRHGQTVIPPGVRAVPYEERYANLHEYDVLISATRSPHFTIKAEELLKLGKIPALWLDLAVPRDIDPAVAELTGVTYYNVDDLGGAGQPHDEKLALLEAIISQHTANFEKWFSYRNELEKEPQKSEYFPLFISARGKRALLVGGGKIAARRAEVLTRFEFDITVIAPDILPEIERMGERGRLTLIKRRFEDGDLDGCFMVIAATDDRELNRRIGEMAAQRGIYASIADSREECSFLFPAIAHSGDIIAGLTSGGKSHSAVAQAAKRVREVL